MARRKNTRNAQGSGSIRWRDDLQLWEARYTVGRNPGTGKQDRKSIYGKTEDAVRKKLAAVTVDIDNGAWIEPTQMKLKEWAAIWLAEYSSDLKENTLIDYKGAMKNHILPALGEAPLQKLQKHHVQTFYNTLTKDKGLSPKTVRNVHGCLHKALNQALELEYIKKNPADRPKLPKVIDPEINPLSQEETAAFLNAADDDPYYDIFFITLFTGLRISEAIGLTWDCISFSRGSIKIYRQYLKTGGGQWGKPKNNKTRIIKPAPLVMKKLREIKRKQAEHQLKHGSAWLNEENFVFTNEIGDRYRHCTVDRHLNKVVAEIEKENFTFHGLRHSYAVASIMAGDDVKTLSENLGHHSVAFTLDKYGHVTDEMRKASSERMEIYMQKTLQLNL